MSSPIPFLLSLLRPSYFLLCVLFSSFPLLPCSSCTLHRKAKLQRSTVQRSQAAVSGRLAHLMARRMRALAMWTLQFRRTMSDPCAIFAVRPHRWMAGVLERDRLLWRKGKIADWSAGGSSGWRHLRWHRSNRLQRRYVLLGVRFHVRRLFVVLGFLLWSLRFSLMIMGEYGRWCVGDAGRRRSPVFQFLIIGNSKKDSLLGWTDKKFRKSVRWAVAGR